MLTSFAQKKTTLQAGSASHWRSSMDKLLEDSEEEENEPLRLILNEL